jgi:hypothetical protein
MNIDGGNILATITTLAAIMAVTAIMASITVPAVTTESGPFLTKKQVAARYCVGAETIDNWTRRKAGFPTPLRLGGKALWRLEDLLAFEAAAARGPTDAA